MDIDKKKQYFENEEGQNQFEKFNREQEIKEYQLNKFHLKFGNKIKFTTFLKKVIKKYNSDLYKNRWYKRNIQPPEDLFWFLFYYAEKYGAECNEKEYKKYGNMFTSSLFRIYNYIFNRMDGQGSVIQILEYKAKRTLLSYILIVLNGDCYKTVKLPVLLFLSKC